MSQEISQKTIYQTVSDAYSANTVYEEAETYMLQMSDASPTKGKASLSEQEQAYNSPYELVDPATLEIVAELFPTPAKGLDFLGRLLRYAKVVQNVLPGLEDLGEYVAIIEVRTIHTLSDLIHMGYDTTHKYVSTFCAVGLLHKYKHSNMRQLVFPLKYILPRSLRALDKLIAHSRPKVQQFARKVKERLLKLNLLAYNGSPAPMTHPNGSAVSLEAMTGIQTLFKALYNPILTVLSSEGIDLTLGEHITTRLVKEVIGKTILPLKMVSEQKTKNADTYNRQQIPPTQAVPNRTYHPQTREYQPESTPIEPAEVDFDARVYPREQKTPAEVDFDARVYPREQKTPAEVDFSSPHSQERKTFVRKSLPLQQRVYHQQQQKETFSTSGVDSSTKGNFSATPEEEPKIFTIEDILTAHFAYLQDDAIDWTAETYVPKKFFEELYDQMYYYYDSLNTKGLLGSTRGYIWQSVESSIIRRLAATYEVDFQPIYAVILYNTGRLDTIEDLYSMATGTSSPQSSIHDTQPPLYSTQPSSPSVEKDPSNSQHRQRKTFSKATVDSYVETYPAESTPTYTSANEVYPSHDSQVDPYTETYPTESTPPVTSKVYPDIDPQELEAREELIRELDLTPEEREGAYKDDLLKIDTETLRNYVQRVKANAVFWKSIDSSAEKSLPEILRIPTISELQNYSSEFTNVLRKRNIYILFNNIYNNITLRNDAVIFLKDIFDKNTTQNYHNGFEHLFEKQTPDALLFAFVDTILNLHEKGGASLKSPGGYFIKRAKQFEKEKADSETIKLVEQYSSLTYEQFTQEMADVAQSGKKLRTKEYRGR